MRQLFRNYRQILSINFTNLTDPKLSEWEEVWCNHQRQVHYENDPDFVMMSSMEDGHLFYFLDYPWMGFEYVFPDEPLDGIRTDNHKRSPRYINPDDVIIEPPSQPGNKLSVHQQIAKVHKAIVNGFQKVKKMAKKLPSALKIAWKELNRSD